MRQYRPQSDAPAKGQRIGTGNTFLWVASDGLSILDDVDHESARGIVTGFGAFSILFGLLPLWAGIRNSDAEGAFWLGALMLVVGTALILFRPNRDRRLRLNVRHGSLDWIPQSRGVTKRRLVAQIGSIGNPYASGVTTLDRDTNEGRTQEIPMGEQMLRVHVWNRRKVVEWRLVIHTGGGTIRIGQFETEESAVALGKLIACVLKYGNDPDARRRVLELPGVSALLGTEMENLLDPAGLPRLELLPPPPPTPG